MFPHGNQFRTTALSPLIPWLVAGLMAVALAPATAGAMPGREYQAQPVQQDLRAPDQTNPAPAVAKSVPVQDLRAPDQTTPPQHAVPSSAGQDLRAPDQIANYVDTTTKPLGSPTPQVYGSHGPLPTSGPLPMSHSVQPTSVEPPSSGDDTDVWLILGIGAAILAACAAGIGVARRSKVTTVGHA